MRKKIIIIFATIICIIMLFAGCDLLQSFDKKDYKVNEFYDLVKESQGYLDIVADEIYNCWYDYIYEDKYSSVDSAIFMAYINTYDEQKTIKEYDEIIKVYFSSAKESPCGQQVKKVMTAYSDYYEFVINVSGSYNTYKNELETKKKALASALRELYYEL